MSLKNVIQVGFAISILILFTACTNQAATEVREVNAEAVFATEDYAEELEIRFFHLESPEGTEKTGLSMLITTPEKQNILIDSGIPQVGPVVDEYLEDLGIDTIDYAISSHPHVDHIGGFLTIFETKEIGKLIELDLPHDSDTYVQMQDLIQEKEIDVEYAEKGDVYEIEDDLTLEILSPAQDIIDTYLVLYDTFSAGIMNDLSLVIKLTYKDTTYLFPGDIYSGIESELVNAFEDELNVDVLVAPHHGQHTSSSSKFIEAVDPAITMIPINLLHSRTTYQDYVDYGSEVYVSQFHGNVLLVSDGERTDIYKEKDESDAEEGSN